MNIALIGYFKSDAVNGIALAGYHLAKHLILQGHEVFIYYFSQKRADCIDDEGIHYRYFKQSYKGVYLDKDFVTFLKKNPDQIEIFHLHSVFNLYNYHISKVLRKNGFPQVLTPHGGYSPQLLQRKFLLKKLFFWLFEKEVIRNAHGMILVQEKELDDVRNVGFLGKVKVIPNPLPLDSLHHLARVPVNSKQMHYLLYLGRFDMEHKGLDLLLRTFKILSQYRSDIHLFLYGDGKDRKDLEDLVETLDIPRVKINAPVYGQEKLKVIDECLLYIQPSRWEVFGMSIIEAMVMGRPVVVSEGCYLAETLEKNAVGLVIPLEENVAAELILGYINNTRSLRNEGDKGKKFALAHYDPAIVARKTLEYYQEILISHV